jgi:hypothetical protein
MTIEENQELRETLRNQGLLIKRDRTWGKHEWVAAIKYNEGYVKVVDCSYENMTDIKYRKQFIFDDYIFNNDEWEMKTLEECTVEEVLLNIKRLKIQIKEQKMIKRLNRIEKDFE